MKIGERGQVTIPKKLRDQFGLGKNSEVDILPDGEQIVIRKRAAKHYPIDEVVGIIKLKFADSVDDYIEQVRGR